MIRPATIDDAALFAAIEAQSFTHRPWTLAMFQAALHDPLYTFFVARREGGVVGFGCVKHAGTEAEIDDIAVAEPFRRQGVASALLNALLDEARSRGAGQVFLEVGALNAPAVALYQKHGFQSVSVRKNYYGEGKDALVLKCIFQNKQ